jgi:diguanylate cyclase (GGDEF)-like protein/PAS domain S-box-containing protein
LRNGTGDITELVGISRDVSESVRLRDELERSHRDLQEAQRLGDAGSWQWDVATDTITWSDNMFRLFGLEPGALVPTHQAYLDRVHPDDRQHVKDTVASARHGAARSAFDHRIVRADGSVRCLTTAGEVVARDEDGSPLRLVGNTLDVTARTTLEQQLRSQRDALAVHAAVVESTEDAVIVADLAGRITAWNAAATRLFGYTAQEAVGQGIDLILEAERAHRFAEVLESLQHGAVRLESVNVCKDGKQILTSVAISHVRDGDGPAIGVVGVARDITEQKRTREREQAQTQQLAHLAFHDPLTSLANRALLNDRLAHALVARRDRAISVLLLDLDDFKAVNDVSGHAAGDRLLVEVAARLRSCVRAEDTVARLGGDEFAILVESGEAEQVTERVLDELARPVLVEERLIVPSASIGIAHSSGAGTPETIMLHADAAMYAAKAAGKGRALHFSPTMAEGVRERADLHEELRRAVDRGEIVVHYQPVVDVQAETLSHMEALVRWQRGDVLSLPGDFLRLAEDSGLILGIGLEVLRRTCEQLHGWLAEDERRSVAVNVSAVQLGHPDFAEQVPRLLASLGVRPAQLVLEVTESLFLDPSTALIDQLTTLRKLGVRVSIDDFGTGYSSLGRLQALPVDSLKIDKSFVDLIRTGREDLPILTSMILMAHSLGLDVTAEGVETRQQAERLVALGCDHLQGYFFARPQPVATALTSASEQAAATFSSIVGGDFNGTSVLLIEDDGVTRAIVRMTLSTEGFDVEEATTGQEGVALASRVAPTAVIVDLGLPDMDGLAVVRALRAQPQLGTTAIVVLTGAAQRDIKTAAFAAGADDYIVKPLAPQHLAARLRGAIRNASSATATSASHA